MSYPLHLEQTHKTTFSDNVGMLAQQMQIPILNAVTRVEASGEAQSVSDMYKAVKAKRAEKRARRNPENPAEAERRWLIYLDDIESGQYLDKEDQVKAAMNPTSVLMNSHMAAVRREIQAAILGVEEAETGRWLIKGRGMLGTATTGKTPTGTVTLPGSQTIPAGGAGLTLAKLREALKRLRKAEFGMEDTDPLYSAISPDQVDDLIGIAASSAGNLNAFNIDQLREGKPTSLLGITWIMTNQVPHTAATGSPVRVVPIWSQRNIVAGFWQDIQGRMWNDPHAKNLPYMLINANLDATRIQDKGVVAVECVEPA